MIYVFVLVWILIGMIFLMRRHFDTDEVFEYLSEQGVLMEAILRRFPKICWIAFFWGLALLYHGILGPIYPLRMKIKEMREEKEL